MLPGQNFPFQVNIPKLQDAFSFRFVCGCTRHALDNHVFVALIRHIQWTIDLPVTK